MEKAGVSVNGTVSQRVLNQKEEFLSCDIPIVFNI
jgi:hypothetical protein